MTTTDHLLDRVEISVHMAFVDANKSPNIRIRIKLMRCIKGITVNQRLKHKRI